MNLTRKGSYREELWKLFYNLEQSWCNASALITSSKVNAAGAEMIYFIVGCLSDRHQFLGLIVSLRLLSEKELNLGSNILTNVWLNELFHTEYITRSYSFSLTLFFSVHLLFGKAMLRSRNQYSGVTTLQGISNKSIDSRKHLSRVAIILRAVPKSFLGISLKCGAILRIFLQLWSVLPSFPPITLTPRI